MIKINIDKQATDEENFTDLIADKGFVPTVCKGLSKLKRKTRFKNGQKILTHFTYYLPMKMTKILMTTNAGSDVEQLKLILLVRIQNGIAETLYLENRVKHTFTI